jgi:site-specific recombinase XerD
MTAPGSENALVPTPGPKPQAGPNSLEVAAEAAAEFIAASKARATREAYASDWRDFEAWCDAHGLPTSPAAPQTVALYLSALASSGRKVSTVRRRCAAIAHVHRSAGHDNPAAHPGVRATLNGITRKLGSAPTKKAALTAEMLDRVVRKIPTADLTGLRDRALLLMGFGGALRRSELVGLDVADVTNHPKGIIVTLRRSKTDQLGAGRAKAIPHGKRLKVVAAFDAWIAGAGIVTGPVFRGVRGPRVLAARLGTTEVARIVKRRAKAAGLDPKVFAGHSLRSGFITSAADAGASLQSIADHAAHEKLDTTLGYVQVSDAFRDHAGKRFL